jgi:hypothetical protein
MTENENPLNPLVTRQARAIEGRSAKLKVTGKLAVAIGMMVNQGLPRQAAAIAANLTDDAVRRAFKKPHVLAHWRAELAALREGERARNVHALVDVRDTSDNAMARVAAAKELERSADEHRADAGAAQQRPGMVIVVIGGDGRERLVAPAARPLVIDQPAQPTPEEGMSAVPSAENHIGEDG